MTVKLKIVPQKDWDILRKYLDAEGVVLIPASNVKGVQTLRFHGMMHDNDVDYDFGGEANVWVDFAPNVDSYAISELCERSTPQLTFEEIQKQNIQ